jgi:hypothetical protein
MWMWILYLVVIGVCWGAFACAVFYPFVVKFKEQAKEFERYKKERQS